MKRFEIKVDIDARIVILARYYMPYIMRENHLVIGFMERSPIYRFPFNSVFFQRDIIGLTKGGLIENATFE